MTDNLYANLTPKEREARKQFLTVRVKKNHPPNLPMDVAPLNDEERREFAACEEIIHRGLTSFAEVGRALLEIRNRRLYKESHATFEAYCRNRWQLGRSHAHRKISAAVVVNYLSPIGDNLPLPTSEAQVRPLVGLPIQAVKDVWAKSVQEAKNGKITASLVARNAVQWRVGHGDHMPNPSLRMAKLYKVDRGNFWDLRQSAQAALNNLDAGETKAASEAVQSMLTLIDHMLAHGFKVIREDCQLPPEYEI
jgi:hypothetical protein